MYCKYSNEILEKILKSRNRELKYTKNQNFWFICELDFGRLRVYLEAYREMIWKLENQKTGPVA